MPSGQYTRSIHFLKGGLLVLFLSICLIESGIGCAEIKADESNGLAQSSFSIYALSRGKGVPGEARQVLEHAREVLQEGQAQGQVTRLVDRRIGLEGETRVCAEFSDEQVAARFFDQLHRFSLGVDLVNLKKRLVPHE